MIIANKTYGQASMKAMVLEKPNTPLALKDVTIPKVKAKEVLLQIEACGVCRTDLHIIDGELPSFNLPLILGHQIVGQVIDCGAEVSKKNLGSRVGVSWLAQTCQKCPFCLSSQENLCDHAIYTGYQRPGGYAEFCTVNADFCFSIPSFFSSYQAAPLLCGGAIGYRAYQMAEKATKIGLYGFGSAAHMLTQLAVYEGKQIFAFTRKTDTASQIFAKSLGATWTGSSDEKSPELLEAAIIFAPVGSLVIDALKNLQKGGKVISAGIHMSDIPSFSYDLLWHERSIQSVANLTRWDAITFLQLAAEAQIKTTTHLYPLDMANQALKDLKEGKIEGSAVLQIRP